MTNQGRARAYLREFGIDKNSWNTHNLSYVSYCLKKEVEIKKSLLRNGPLIKRVIQKKGFITENQKFINQRLYVKMRLLCLFFPSEILVLRDQSARKPPLADKLDVLDRAFLFKPLGVIKCFANPNCEIP